MKKLLPTITLLASLNSTWAEALDKKDFTSKMTLCSETQSLTIKDSVKQILSNNPYNVTRLSEHYFKDDFNVYFKTWLHNSPRVVNWADTKSFTVIDESIWKDFSAVYYKEYRSTSIDVWSYRYLWENYWIDKYGIYIWTEKISEDRTFIHLWFWYAKDSKKCYHYWEIIKNADPDTFKVLNKYYAVDKINAYSWSKSICRSEYFKTLWETFATDGIYVYWDWWSRISQDPASFRVIDHNYAIDDKWLIRSDRHVKWVKDWNTKTIHPEWSYDHFEDKWFKTWNAIWYDLHLMWVSNPDEFKAFKYWYWTDDRYIYWWHGSKKRWYWDAKTFNILDKTFIKDKDHVYRFDEVVSDADPKSFRPLTFKVQCDDKRAFMLLKKRHYNKDWILFYQNPYYELNNTVFWTDGSNIYFRDWEKHPWDPETFEILIDNWKLLLTRDHKYVYLNAKKLIWADPASIIYLGWYIFKDKSNIFHISWNTIIWADPATIKSISYSYSMDKNNIYFLWEKIEDIDRNSFQVFKSSNNYCADKDKVYYKWIKLDFRYDRASIVEHLWDLKDKYWIIKFWERASNL